MQLNICKKRCKSGFTLMELVVALAIMGILISAVFSFFGFSLNTFKKSVSNLDEQSSLRLLSFKLTDILRNIGSIDLGTSTFNNIENGSIDELIFLNTDGVMRGDENSVARVSDDEIKGIIFDLIKRDSKYYLGLTISGKTDSYSTEILLNNIIDEAAQVGSGDIDGSNFSSIRFNYNKPPINITPFPDAPTPTNAPPPAVTPLSLNAPTTTIKKNQTYVYQAIASGGLLPYSYSFTDIAWTGTAIPIQTLNRIEWTPTNKPLIMTFKITVTDSSTPVKQISYTVTVTSN